MITKYGRMLTFALIFGVICLSDSLSAAEKKVVADKVMTSAEVDKAFDGVFQTQKKLERMQARVVTEKVGGIFKKAKANEAFVYAQMPDKLYYVDKGNLGENASPEEYSMILIDGVFLWDIKPADGKGVREAEQIDMKSAGNKDINIAALLIGADVASGKELRDYYDISGKFEKFADGSKSYHFTLKTIAGKEKKKRKEIVDMWITPGGVIPWKIESVRLVPKVNPLNPQAPATMKKTASVKYITDLQTNLSKQALPAFKPDTFYFGRIMRENPGMKVVDGKGNVIAKEVLQTELAGILKRLQK